MATYTGTLEPNPTNQTGLRLPQNHQGGFRQPASFRGRFFGSSKPVPPDMGRKSIGLLEELSQPTTTPTTARQSAPHAGQPDV